MKRQNRLVYILVPAALTTAVLSSASLCRGQTPGQTQDSPPSAGVSDSLRDLQERMRELKSMLSAMSAEATRSGDEIKTLHQELRETREDLAAVKGQLADLKSKHSPATGLALAVGSGGSSGPLQEVDSRLAKLQEDQQLQSAKIDDQYQTKVESASKYRLKLSGIALLNAFSNRGSVDNIDLPSFAVGRNPGDGGGSFGATVRQSMMGLEVFGPDLGGARTSAEIQVDFFGGFPSTWDGATMGLVRLRTATARMDWSRTSIVAGQDAPFFSPLSPTSFASLALPALSYSGNLWTWTPQLRVEHRVEISDGSSVMIQGGILDPLTGEFPSDPFFRSPEAGEMARQPAYATRFAWTHGPRDRSLTVGAGGYYARQHWGFGRRVDAWAGTADWNLPLFSRLSLAGELYRGRALGGLGGGAGRSILSNGSLTNPATSVVGLNTMGGWAQLKFMAAEKLELNGAFGEDNPVASDLRRFAAGQTGNYGLMSRNQTAFLNFVYRPRSNLLFSAEYRHLWTSEIDRDKFSADQVNLSIGVLY
jgi:hypothetical protein